METCLHVKKSVQKIVTSETFKKIFTVFGIIFVILSYFITVQPSTFLQLSYFGVFLYNTINSGLLIMPVLTEKMNLWLVILASALGNIPNTSINYLVGNSSNRLFSGNKYIGYAKKFINKFGLLAVYILAILPLPLDVNGLLSGYMGIPYKKYILVNFLGKVTIFFLVGMGIITLTETLR
jgi:membrane protein YqaA with SNARE-associated domain